MANPKLPGIPEAEQALLYAKLNGEGDTQGQGYSGCCQEP